MRFLPVVLAMALFVAGFPTAGPAQDAPTSGTQPLGAEAPPARRDAFLRQMAERLGSIQNLRAEFVQERHLSLFMDTLTARGVCLFQAPDRLRWQVDTPSLSILINNGGKVAQFDQVDGRLRKMQPGAREVLEEVLGQIQGWMRGRFDQAQDTYSLALFEGPPPRLVLTPRAPGLRRVLAAIELTVDPGTSRVEQVVIREPGGDRVEIRFENQKTGEAADAALFDLDHPLYPAK